MSVIYVLLPLAMVIAGLFVALFVWSVRSGQMDDLDTPAKRVAFEDDDAPGTTRPNATIDRGPR
jgi:cbb3-type cytochrome oxidase maturation protein